MTAARRIDVQRKAAGRRKPCVARQERRRTRRPLRTRRRLTPSRSTVPPGAPEPAIDPQPRRRAASTARAPGDAFAHGPDREPGTATALAPISRAGRPPPPASLRARSGSGQPTRPPGACGAPRHDHRRPARHGSVRPARAPCPTEPPWPRPRSGPRRPPHRRRRRRDPRPAPPAAPRRSAGRHRSFLRRPPDDAGHPPEVAGRGRPEQGQVGLGAGRPQHAVAPSGHQDRHRREPRPRGAGRCPRPGEHPPRRPCTSWIRRLARAGASARSTPAARVSSLPPAASPRKTRSPASSCKVASAATVWKGCRR